MVFLSLGLLLPQDRNSSLWKLSDLVVGIQVEPPFHARLCQSAWERGRFPGKSTLLPARDLTADARSYVTVWKAGRSHYRSDQIGPGRSRQSPEECSLPRDVHHRQGMESYRYRVECLTETWHSLRKQTS